MTTDHLDSLGALALASRLRRLLYRLQAEGLRVYEELGVEFKPKWFPVFQLIDTHPGATTTGIARELRLAHPSVIAIVEDLKRHGLVDAHRDEEDRRRRELVLTARGKRTRTRLEPVWQAFAEAGREIVTEDGHDFIAAMDGLERALERRSLHERIMERLERRA